jgi:hypothetical protein
MRREITAIVKSCRKGDSKPGKKICLYTKDGKRLLGAHKSEQDAHKQEAAIHAKSSVAAVLDDVAAELERRRAFKLSAEVDAGLADLVDDEIEEELNRAGFTKNVLTRDSDVAEQIYEERIPNIDLVTYEDTH